MIAMIRMLAVLACLIGQVWTETLLARQVASHQSAETSNVARASENMVASVHPLATSAGISALESGGNAVDAAIATALMLGVVDGYNSGIGGGCFILIRLPDGRFIAIDGREVAPAAAQRDMYIESGKPNTKASQTGPLAVAVPGALAAYTEAVAQYGRKPIADSLNRAADVAENGFEISSIYARQIRNTAEELRPFSGSQAILLDPQGKPWPAGHRLQQIDLAETYRQIAANGLDWFYRGPFAERTAAWMAENGGILSVEDFKQYRTRQREPLISTYRDLQVIGFPPPSSGGVHVAQMLNILESFDLAKIHRDDPALATHYVAEAMKLAFADRAHWLGDPAFADVPRGLVDRDYAKQLATRIQDSQSIEVEGPGQPSEFDPRFFEKHTTHIAAADREGYWVAITTTVNTTFGSKVIVPGLGVVLNNQMDDFAIAPGVPNAFGLVGNENNQIAPGKRPLSSMSPTILLRDGKPLMTLGAAGGPRIITQALLAILRTQDFAQPLADAIGQPRFHQQWSPPLLYLEQGFPEDQQRSLVEKGHRIEISRTAGVTQAIWFDESSQQFVGVADPRAQGSARGTK